MRSALKKFIVSRVLSDSDVLLKYTKGRCKVPSGKFEKQYRAEMRSLVLYRMLVLIFFLDEAKMSNVLDKVPRLDKSLKVVSRGSRNDDVAERGKLSGRRGRWWG